MSIGNNQNQKKYLRVIWKVSRIIVRDINHQKGTITTFIRGKQIEETIGSEPVQVGNREEERSQKVIVMVERVVVE